jgi:hypothetical protein
VTVRIRMSDYVGTLTSPRQSFLYKQLGIQLTTFNDDTITDIWFETDPPKWSYITSNQGRGQGECRVWTAKLQMVGQDEVGCCYNRMECDIVGEMHRIWVCDRRQYRDDGILIVHPISVL